MSTHSQEMTSSDYVAMLRRRWRPTIAVMAIIALGTIYVAYALPAVYESSASILIEQQGIPTDFVQTTVNAYAEQLLQTIYERVVSSENVLSLIAEHDLYPEDRDSLSEEELFVQFRESTIMAPKNVETVHSRTGREAIITFGFEISYQYSDPTKARDVAADLADMFVSINSALRAETAARTTAFLDAESAQVQASLSEIAKRIAEFKAVHVNNLPENQEVNLRTWERLNDDLNLVDTQLRDAREERALLQTEIVDTPRYRPVLDESGQPVIGGIDRLAEAQQELIRLLGRYSENHPEVQNLRREIAALSPSSASQAHYEQQLRTDLENNRRALSEARQKYSESHPDVVDLRNTVSSLEAQLAEVERNRDRNYSSQMPPNNPPYLQLQTRISTLSEEISALDRRRTVTSGRIAELERLQMLAPQVERDFAQLTNERDMLLVRYRELNNLGDEAALGEALETNQSGERLVIVESPRVPSDPVSPNRISLSLLGIILGVALGLGSASLSEAMDKKVRGRRDITLILEAPPIGIIPYVESRPDTLKRRVTNSALIVAVAGATAFVVGTAL
jgi:uncharacterized protein involved in exopolysaccharide biosynthesis